MGEALVSFDFGEISIADFSPPENWAAAVGDCCWARGDRSIIKRPPSLPHDGAVDVFVTVDPSPESLGHQTINVIAEGETKRTLSLEARTLFGFSLKNEASIHGDGSLFEIEHSIRSLSADSGLSLGFINITVVPQPKARPKPIFTQLPSQIQPPRTELLDLTDEDLMRRFVSLGDNCEFGLAQRSFGADPMDMLRFVGIQFAGLLKGLDCDFDRLESIDDIYFRLVGREYIFANSRFGVQMHTLLFEGENTPQQLFHRQLTKLFLQRRLLVEDLISSQRIFVYKQNYPISEDHLEQLFNRLQLKAPNTLLSVVLADEFHAPGTVIRIGRRLLRGYIDFFSPYDDAAGVRSDYWLTICRNAFRLWNEETSTTAGAPAGELTT